MEPIQTNKVIEAIIIFKSVFEYLKEIKKFLDKSKKRRLKLFGSKKEETERMFKEALMGSKNAIESIIWSGKGFALQEECGIKVDKEFHHLMGLLIQIFNDISMRLDREKLDEKLVEPLEGQLKILVGDAQWFWNIQGINSHEDKEKDTLKIIENFRSRLRHFQKSMEPYLRQKENENKNIDK